MKLKRENIKTFLILLISSILLIFILKLIFNLYYTDACFYIGVGFGLIAFVLKTETFNFLPRKNLLSKDFPRTTEDVLEDIEKRKKTKLGFSSYKTKELPYYFAIIAFIHIVLSIMLVFIQMQS